MAIICTASDRSNDKPVVMVLGTYHLANPGLDAVKVKQRDALGADRQQEIAELVDRLARFRPSKILVEAVPAKQSELDKQYADFISGKQPLSSSETQQIGFRLAKRFNLVGVTGVDYKSDMDFERTLGFAARNGMPEIPARFGKLIEQIGALMNEWDRKYTVLQLLAIHNSPEMQRQSHAVYLEFLPVTDGKEYPGADLVAGWYRRNLVIYQNIVSSLKAGDRALVIYGSGHAYLLNRLLQEGGRVYLKEARKYLPRAPAVSLPELR